jgi:PhnB protein
MTTTHILPRPAGHHSVTPGFSVPNAAKVVSFLETAFGGRVLERYDMPNGAIAHAEILLGDSVVMLGDASKEMPGHEAMPASLSYYVSSGAEVDATYKRALANGATSLMEPANQFYGYRSATVVDVGGNRWTICAVIEQLTKEQIAERMKDIKH